MSDLQDGLIQWAIAALVSMVAGCGFYAATNTPLPIAASATFIAAMSILVCVFYFIVGTVSLYVAGRHLWSQRYA